MKWLKDWWLSKWNSNVIERSLKKHLHQAAIIKQRVNKKVNKQRVNKKVNGVYTVDDLNSKPGNAIYVIHPYKLQGIWVFDDAAKDIVKEPFVSGADELLDFLSEYSMKCTVVFSGDKFPEAKFKLKKTVEEGQGAWYSLIQLATNADTKDIVIKSGWLCAVVRQYFNGEVPDEIFLCTK